MSARKNGRTASTYWGYAVSTERALATINDGRKQKRGARTPAPINWASLRGDLDSMLEAREGVLLLGMYNSPDASESSSGLRLALRASSEYILELTRCLAERPQGKGGWQRAAKLDGLREQVVAAIDAA